MAESEVIIESVIPPLDLPIVANPNETDYSDQEAPFGRFANGKPRKHPVGGASGNGKRSAPKFSLTQDELAQQIIEMSIPVAFMSPLAAAVIDERANRTAAALITLARNSPKFAKALASATSGAAYAELIFLPIGIMVAVMVDYGKMSPENFVAKKFNIDVHYHTFIMANGGPNVAPEQNGNGHHPDVDSRSGLI